MGNIISLNAFRASTTTSNASNASTTTSDASVASTTTSDASDASVASVASTLTHTGAELQSVEIITVIGGEPTYYYNVLNFIVTDRLKLFYGALFEIRKVLEEPHPSISCGLANRAPPEYYNLRSSGYLVLAISSYPASECSNGFTELLELICTPFGCVHPFNSGYIISRWMEATHNLMSTMESRWTIEDCTDRIKYFPIYNDYLDGFIHNSGDIVGTAQKRFFEYDKDNSKHRKFYIVKNVDNIELPTNGEIIVAGKIYGLNNVNLARQVFESCASQSHV
jgi:hypothetical protein